MDGKELIGTVIGATTTDWTNYRIPVSSDEGDQIWDVRYDHGTIDIMVDGVNKYTLSFDDAFLLLNAITEVMDEAICGEKE